jgi:hypothetical protein
MIAAFTGENLRTPPIKDRMNLWIIFSGSGNIRFCSVHHSRHWGMILSKTVSGWMILCFLA